MAIYEISALERMTRLSSAVISPGITREEIDNLFFANRVLREHESSCIFARSLLTNDCWMRLTKNAEVLLICDDKVDDLLRNPIRLLCKTINEGGVA